MSKNVWFGLWSWFFSTLRPELLPQQNASLVNPHEEQCSLDIWFELEIARGMNPEKTELMCFNKDGAISSSNNKSLKLWDQFIYLSSNISSTESNVSNP